MRLWHVTIGGLVMACVIVVAGNAAYTVYRRDALHWQSQSFADAAVSAITARWDAKQLLDRATPRLGSSPRPAQWKSLFETLARQLGPLVDYPGAAGNTCAPDVANPDGPTEAAYVYIAHAKFRAGGATVQISVLKRDGRWMIDYFQVVADQPPVHGGAT
jgi:hypothetical protein